MNKLEMAEIAKAHWRQYHPASFKELKANGTLDKEAAACAELTQREMDVVMATTGMTAMEAWIESRHLFCLKDPLDV